MEDIQAKRQAMVARYVKSQRHTIQVDWIPFMDELAELNGCKPDMSESGVQFQQYAPANFIGCLQI